MNRPSRAQYYMSLALDTAKRSTCMRLNVGAVLVRDRNPIAFGYNGAPSGEDHCKGNFCPGKEVCTQTIHAEENAIRRWDSVGPVDLFTTDSPCPSCTALIIMSGIRRVFFAYPYRITDHLSMFGVQGIGVYRVLPAGYVMDWFTRELVEIDL